MMLPAYRLPSRCMTQLCRHLLNSSRVTSRIVVPISSLHQSVSCSHSSRAIKTHLLTRNRFPFLLQFPAEYSNEPDPDSPEEKKKRTENIAKSYKRAGFVMIGASLGTMILMIVHYG